MPTGIALRDARGQLFDAAGRILVRDGPSALTSRAVTAEAGVAKGVLHRHFADFDAFLADLVLDRVAQLDGPAAALRDATGTGAIADNLTVAVLAICGPVAVAIVALIITRDGLRARLREAGAARFPIVTEGTAMIASYLSAERDLGRISADADITALAATLMGAVHLLFADRETAWPEPEAVRRVVVAVVAGVVPGAAI
jgi:AcrR family transcriptional regulator